MPKRMFSFPYKFSIFNFQFSIANIVYGRLATLYIQMVVWFGREDEVGHRPSTFGIKRLNRTMINKKEDFVCIAFNEERRYRAGCKIMRERAIARSGTIHGEGTSVHVQVHDHFLSFVVGESDERILEKVQNPDETRLRHP